MPLDMFETAAMEQCLPQNTLIKYLNPCIMAYPYSNDHKNHEHEFNK